MGFVAFLLVPVLTFAVLDVYYLKLEWNVRFLFEQVRLDKHEVDFFSMELTHDPLDIISAKARTWDCTKSPSIYLFPIDDSNFNCFLYSKIEKGNLRARLKIV